MVTIEDLLVLFGFLSLFPVAFSIMRKSNENCFLRIGSDRIEYANISFGWPLRKRATFSVSEVTSLTTDEDSLYVDLNADSEHHKADKDEGDHDLEIDAVVFGLKPEQLRAQMKQDFSE